MRTQFSRNTWMEEYRCGRESYVKVILKLVLQKYSVKV